MNPLSHEDVGHFSKPGFEATNSILPEKDPKTVFAADNLTAWAKEKPGMEAEG
jgi:hypothetical protein